MLLCIGSVYNQRIQDRLRIVCAGDQCVRAFDAVQCLGQFRLPHDRGVHIAAHKGKTGLGGVGHLGQVDIFLGETAAVFQGCQEEIIGGCCRIQCQRLAGQIIQALYIGCRHQTVCAAGCIHCQDVTARSSVCKHLDVRILRCRKELYAALHQKRCVGGFIFDDLNVHVDAGILKITHLLRDEHRGVSRPGAECHGYVFCLGCRYADCAKNKRCRQNCRKQCLFQILSHH